MISVLRKGMGLIAVCFLFVPLAVDAYISPGVPEGFVNDFAQVLSAEEEADLESATQAYEKRSTYEIALVTVPTTKEETIDSYAVELFKEWGIGKRDQDSGVLVVAAIQDRKIRIEVGYGLESLLTDAASARIIQRATPLLQEGRYYQALSQIQFEIESTLSGYEEGDGIIASSGTGAFVEVTDRFIQRLPPGVGGLLLIVFFFFLIAFGRFLLGFVLALLAYCASYLFSVLTGRPRPVLRCFFSGATTGFFAGILSGIFRGGGGFGGGSSGGGFGGGRSGGGGSSSGW